MDINDIRSLVTLLGLALFAGLIGWTLWPSRRADHDAAAQLPFQDEADAPNRTANEKGRP